MELADALLEMPWYKKLRRGQRAVANAYLTSTSEIALLPTGYGKTLSAAVAFAILYWRGVAERIVVAVPRTVQATQAANELKGLLHALGIETEAWVVNEHRVQAFKAWRERTAKVFVFTIQSLLETGKTAEYLQSIMADGKSLLVADECHHYGCGDSDKVAKWTQWLLKLPRSSFLAMSATPDREGEKSPFGPPTIRVSYREALEKEGAVKRLRLHAYDYQLGVVYQGGKTDSFRLSEFLETVGDDPDEIQRNMAKRQMRWMPDYVSPLIERPVGRLVDLYATDLVRGQMIVRALCCSHAEVVCEQIRALVPCGMKVDWVGTGEFGRSDEDNKKALARFCPPKGPDGKRHWTLDILVQVGMAGEGLDTNDVVEVVFLTNPRGTISDLQLIGRGARRMTKEDVVCTVNVDAGCEMAKYLGESIMDIFDRIAPPPEPDPNKPKDPPEPPVDVYRPIPPGPIVLVDEIKFLEVRQHPEFANFRDELCEGAQRCGVSFADVSQEEVDAWAEAAFAKIISRRDEKYSASYRVNELRSLINLRTQKVTGLALKVLARKGLVKYSGVVKTAINRKKDAAFGSVTTADVNCLQLHNQWLIKLQDDLLTDDIPSWLRDAA